VAVSSDVGKGTTITLVIPFINKHLPQHEHAFEQELRELRLQSQHFNSINIAVKQCCGEILCSYLSLILPNISLQCSETESNEHIDILFNTVPDIVTLSVSNRGDSNRLNHVDYLTNPIKVHELVSLLLKKFHEVYKNPENPSPSHEAKIDLSKYSAKELLIVDDNVINRRVLERMLRIIGFTKIESACDGSEAVSKFSPGRFDIVLMDLQMPVMGGKAACLQMREIEKSTNKRSNIVALTANVWETKQNLTANSKFDSVLYKPVMLDTLRELIDTFVK